jgi:peptidoglycan-associated lipoprotein
MRIAFTLILVGLLASVSGCSCLARKVGPGEDNIPVAGEGGVLQDIHFAFDSYALDNSSRVVLKRNYEWLAANPNAEAEVEGHCDERGTNEYNMALGMKRARAAQEYLVSLGIKAARLNTVSYGKELPLDPAHTEEAWAKNRRVHFVVK